jgi:hypothetical protein
VWVGIQKRFSWTGYKKQMKDTLLLLDAIHIAFSRPEYHPEDGKTHCNQFVDEVCEAYGFKELRGKLANQICDYLARHPEWGEVVMERTQQLANQGSLVVGGVKADPHGHVVIVCPGREKESGRWGKVPGCASVGAINSIGLGVNWSFSQMPKFYVWRRTI